MMCEVGVLCDREGGMMCVVGVLGGREGGMMCVVGYWVVGRVG